MRNEENKKQANKFLNHDYHEDYQGEFPIHSKTLNQNDQLKKPGFIFKNNEQHS